jgi:GNAT superfamily N-acetyltransferase
LIIYYDYKTDSKRRTAFMQIRSFQASDADGVKELVSSIMSQEYPKSQKAYEYGDLDKISDAYGKLRERFLVAEEESKVVGSVGIKEDDDSTALLRRFFVHKSHRGRGIGSMLVDTALDFCKMNGYKKVVFRATADMEAAIGVLTKKKGFSEQEKYLFDDIEIIMLDYKLH